MVVKNFFSNTKNDFYLLRNYPSIDGLKRQIFYIFQVLGIALLTPLGIYTGENILNLRKFTQS